MYDAASLDEMVRLVGEMTESFEYGSSIGIEESMYREVFGLKPAGRATSGRRMLIGGKLVPHFDMASFYDIGRNRGALSVYLTVPVPSDVLAVPEMGRFYFGSWSMEDGGDLVGAEDVQKRYDGFCRDAGVDVPFVADVLKGSVPDGEYERMYIPDSSSFFYANASSGM